MEKTKNISQTWLNYQSMPTIIWISWESGWNHTKRSNQANHQNEVLPTVQAMLHQKDLLPKPDGTRVLVLFFTWRAPVGSKHFGIWHNCAIPRHGHCSSSGPCDLALPKTSSSTCKPLPPSPQSFTHPLALEKTEDRQEQGVPPLLNTSLAAVQSNCRSHRGTTRSTAFTYNTLQRIAGPIVHYSFWIHTTIKADCDYFLSPALLPLTSSERFPYLEPQNPPLLLSLPPWSHSWQFTMRMFEDKPSEQHYKTLIFEVY